MRDVAPIQGFPEPYDLLLAILEDGTHEWRQELFVDELPPEVMTWNLSPDGPSIGAIYLHMIAVEVGWFERFVLGRSIDDETKRRLMCDEIDVDSGTWPDPPAEPLTWYYALQNEFRKRTYETIRAWPDADSPIPKRDEAITPRWVFGHVIQHEAYHAGQMIMIYDQYQRLSK